MKTRKKQASNALVAVGDCVRPRQEKAIPAEHPDLPFVGLEHVESHSMRLLDVGSAAEMRSAANVFKRGDVLYSRLRPYLNKVWFADRDGLCSSEFIVLPQNSRIDGRFLCYRLNSREFVEFANRLNTGDRPRVNFKQIAEFKTILPPLAEQERIVAEIERRLTHLEAGVTALRRVERHLRRYRASVLKAACEGRLVPTEAELARKEKRDYETGEQLLTRILAERRNRFTGRGKYKEPAAPKTDELGSLPKGWTWATVELVTSNATIGLDRGRAQQSRDSLGRTPYVKMNNVTMDGRVLFDDIVYVPASDGEITQFRLVENDILFNTRNSKELVGKNGLVKNPPEHVISVVRCNRRSRKN